MGTPYVYERQTEYWTSSQIENYFFDLGYEIVTFPLSQRSENLVPADFIFDGQVGEKFIKLFGFQYKALYKNKRDYWPISKKQHERLQLFPWIYYNFPVLRNSRQYRTALYTCRIVKNNFEYKNKIYVSRREQDRKYFYCGWEAFYQGLEKCIYGAKVDSKDHLHALINPDNMDNLPEELNTLLIDIFLVNFDNQRIVHFSPFLQDFGSQFQFE